MHYIIYLIIFVVLSIFGTVTWVIDGALTLNFSSMYNFIDAPTLIFIVVACIIVLWATKNIRPFARAIGFMFTKKELTEDERKKSLSAVKAVMLSALFSCGIYIFIKTINFLSRMDLSSGLNYIGVPIGSALISGFYAFSICMILLPVYIALKNKTEKK
ncbi:MAG: hypothetical protein IJC39_03135 [Firmicutes bacterium]|nr:hypothetical protein [Bacillota bacterium]